MTRCTNLNDHHPIDTNAMAAEFIDQPLSIRPNDPDEVYTPASFGDGYGLVGPLASWPTFKTRRRDCLSRSRYRLYFDNNRQSSSARKSPKGSATTMKILVDICGKLEKLVLWMGIPSLNTLMDPLTRHLAVILAVLSKERGDHKSSSYNLISALHSSSQQFLPSSSKRSDAWVMYES